MAIKGKGKTKPKQPARAPRREPVPVKPPFAKRTWVKMTAAFIAGVFLLSMCWWVWENLDQDRNAKAFANAQAQQRQAISAWTAELQADLANVAQIQGGAVPQIATTIKPALDALQQGKPPQTTAKDMDTLAGQLGDAAKKLGTFQVSEAIKDHGFTADQAEGITAAQTELLGAIQAYHVAAQLTSLALSTPGQQDAVVAAASESLDTAQQLLTSGWTKYANASNAAGAPLPIPQGLSPQSGS
jgi:hypothetical protein